MYIYALQCFPYLGRNDVLVHEVLRQNFDHLHLLLRCEASHCRLDDSTNGRVVDGNEARIVEERNRAHDELTIHTIGHASVSRNGVAKILDLESALQSRGKEATEGRNERGKRGEDEDVELNRHDIEGSRNGKARRNEGQRIVARHEDGVGPALKASVNVCAEILNRKLAKKIQGHRLGNAR